MDESLAELAVRTRRTSSRAGELAKALADGTVIKAFAFRGSMHYLSPEEGGIYLALRSAGRQWELPSWVEYYRLTPSDWPDFRAAVREALSDGPLTVRELGDVVAADRSYRHLKPVFDEGAGTLIKPLTWQGDISFGLPRDGQHTFQRLDLNPRWAGLPGLDEAGPRAITAYLRTYGPATFDHVHYWLGDGLSAGRKRLDHVAVRAPRPPDSSRRRGHHCVRRAGGRRFAGRCAAVGCTAVPSRARPVGDGPWHQGRQRHPTIATGPRHPQGQPLDRRRCRLRDLGANGRRAHGHLARRATATRGGHRAGSRAAGWHPRSRPTPATKPRSRLGRVTLRCSLRPGGSPICDGCAGVSGQCSAFVQPELVAVRVGQLDAVSQVSKNGRTERDQPFGLAGRGQR